MLSTFNTFPIRRLGTRRKSLGLSKRWVNNFYIKKEKVGFFIQPFRIIFKTELLLLFNKNHLLCLYKVVGASLSVNSVEVHSTCKV